MPGAGLPERVTTTPRRFSVSTADQAGRSAGTNVAGGGTSFSLSRSASPRGLTSGQLSYDRSQRVGEVGADDDIGEADLLPSPLDFLGGGRRVIRKYGQRVRCAKRSRVGVGGRHERRDRVADDRHVQRELDVADGAEVACQPRDVDPRLTRQLYEGDRVCDVGRQRLGLRTAYGHHHRRVKARGRRDLAAP